MKQTPPLPTPYSPCFFRAAQAVVSNAGADLGVLILNHEGSLAVVSQYVNSQVHPFEIKPLSNRTEILAKNLQFSVLEYRDILDKFKLKADDTGTT